MATRVRAKLEKSLKSTMTGGEEVPHPQSDHGSIAL